MGYIRYSNFVQMHIYSSFMIPVSLLRDDSFVTTATPSHERAEEEQHMIDL